MRKGFVWTIVFAALTLGPHTRAHAAALDVWGMLNSLYGLVCNSLTIDIGGVKVKTPPITSILDLKAFCRTYDALVKLKDYEKFLNSTGRNAIQDLISNAVNGFLAGLSGGLASDPGYRAFADGFNKVMDGISEAIDTLYSIPYQAVSSVTSEAYARFYYQTLNALKKDRGAPAPSVDADGVLGEMTPPEQVQGLAGDYEVPRPTAGQVAEANSAAKRVESTLSEMGGEYAKSVAEAARQADAEKEAKRAAERSEAGFRQSILKEQSKKQTEVLRSLSEAASQVTAEITPTGEKGIAKQFVEDARNAPSDRRLLELQVEALASIMEQNATYATKTAELLVEIARQQVFTTQGVIDAVKKQQREAEEAASSISEQAMAKYYESKLKASDPAKEQLSVLTFTLCAFYGGSEDEASCRALLGPQTASSGAP